MGEREYSIVLSKDCKAKTYKVQPISIESMMKKKVLRTHVIKKPMLQGSSSSNDDISMS